MLNQQRLDQLVIKTYHFVSPMLSGYRRQETAVVDIILALHKGLPYDAATLRQDIQEAYRRITIKEPWKLESPEWNISQVWVY